MQHRGSIPVMWHQESNQMTPRPPIESELARSLHLPRAYDCGSNVERPFLLAGSAAL